MLFNSVFTIFWDFNIQCRVCYTACSVNRRETVSLFKFPIKSLMIPFELNWPVSLITIYILYVIITTRTCSHAWWFENCIIFHIIYIITIPFSPAWQTARLVPGLMKARLPKNEMCRDWLAAPVRCDWRTVLPRPLPKQQVRQNCFVKSVPVAQW